MMKLFDDRLVDATRLKRENRAYRNQQAVLVTISLVAATLIATLAGLETFVA